MNKKQLDKISRRCIDVFSNIFIECTLCAMRFLKFGFPRWVRQARSLLLYNLHQVGKDKKKKKMTILIIKEISEMIYAIKEFEENAPLESDSKIFLFLIGLASLKKG